MKLKNLSQNEIDGLIFADLAHMVLSEKGELNTAKLYRYITDLKKMSDDEYEDTIADFFAILSTDKRFILLENGIWGLKCNHLSRNQIHEEELDDSEVIDEENEDETEDENEEDIELLEDDDDFEENDMADLVIIDEEELFEE